MGVLLKTIKRSLAKLNIKHRMCCDKPIDYKILAKFFLDIIAWLYGEGGNSHILTYQGRRQLLTTGGGGLIYEKHSIRSNTTGGLGHCKPPSGSRAEPWWGSRGQISGALKSLQSTLPEVVEKSTFVGHFFYVLHLKVTEKNH